MQFALVTLIVQSYLLFLSLYHIWTGTISYCFPAFAMSFYRKAYGCDPVEQRHLKIILRPWGALAIFAGIAGLSAVPDPQDNLWIVTGIALLLLMRMGYRITLRRELLEISGIEPRRNLISITTLFLGFCLLVSAIISEL